MSSLCAALALGAAPGVPASDDVLRRLAEEARARERIAYTAIHRYTVINDRFGQRATLDLQLTTIGGRLQVKVLREEGSEALRRRVLARLVARYHRVAEGSGGRPWQIAPEWYEFVRLPDVAVEPNLCRYQVRPRRGTEGGLEGTIWVNRAEAAVMRFEGRLARRPSIWVARPVLTQTYGKVGGHWWLDRVEGYADSPWAGRTRFSLEVVDFTPAPADSDGSTKDGR
jgi:hypothetical protein